MNLIPASHYLVFSLVLFCAGLFGLATRRKERVRFLLSVELILAAAAVNLGVFSHTALRLPEEGQIFAFFAVILSAALSAAGAGALDVLDRDGRRSGPESL